MAVVTKPAQSASRAVMKKLHHNRHRPITQVFNRDVLNRATMTKITLASSSPIRLQLLENVGLSVRTHPVRVDEDAIREALIAEDASPRDIADTLAEYKARRASDQCPADLILAADQVLALKRQVFAKPNDRDEAAEHLELLSGQTHHLYSAACIYQAGKPLWRHVGTARMTMHAHTSAEIQVYLQQAWPDACYCVGAYQAEGFGAKLFSRIEGDWFSVLGLPLLDILSYLRLRGSDDHG
ncbi:Maf family protein [Gymnodinialimonas sp. 2305UL16-5]|uniref:Maf family protein n=1 Tax=Gymnodinialimonas mytili TaxID=3126503 RepID=UPI003098EFB4